jgi:hypothetical protein
VLGLDDVDIEYESDGDTEGSPVPDTVVGDLRIPQFLLQGNPAQETLLDCIGINGVRPLRVE